MPRDVTGLSEPGRREERGVGTASPFDRWLCMYACVCVCLYQDAVSTGGQGAPTPDMRPPITTFSRDWY